MSGQAPPPARGRALAQARTDALGEELYRALRSQAVVSPLTEREPAITIDDAYQVSLRMMQLRQQQDGERIVGKKIGVTSAAVQQMLGVFQPDFGFLSDAMAYPDGAEISITKQLIQPRAEAEIAFRLCRDLAGPGITEEEVLAATEYISPCFEIVDSRIRDWEIKIQDTIADNASCGVYVLGSAQVSPRGLSLPKLKVQVYKNGNFLSEGLGSAVQGNPLTAVAWLANTLGGYGISLSSGEIILSGSLVPLEPVSPGDAMHIELSQVGSAELRFC